MLTCSYKTVVGGNSEFIRCVAIPLEDQLSSSGISRNDTELEKTFALDSRPRNEPLIIAGFVGIVLFVASRFAGKFLDDIYASKIQPRVKKALEQADQKLTGANSSKKKLFQFGVCYDEPRVLILVAVYANSFDEILEQLHAIPTLQMTGIELALANGCQKMVHVYCVENGQTNIAPLLFDSLGEAQAYLGKKQFCPPSGQ